MKEVEKELIVIDPPKKINQVVPIDSIASSENFFERRQKVIDDRKNLTNLQNFEIGFGVQPVSLVKPTNNLSAIAEVSQEDIQDEIKA